MRGVCAPPMIFGHGAMGKGTIPRPSANLRSLRQVADTFRVLENRFGDHFEEPNLFQIGTQTFPKWFNMGTRLLPDVLQSNWTPACGQRRLQPPTQTQSFDHSGAKD